MKDDKAEEVKPSNAEEEVSVSTPEETKATSEEVVEEEVKSEATDETKSEAKTEEVKPTRQEKRIQQLLGKLKEVGQQTEQEYGASIETPPMADSQAQEEVKLPWETDESFVPGREYSVQELEQIVANKVRQELSKKGQVDKVQSAIKEYAEDIEWLNREAQELSDPEFDDKLSNLIVKMNSDEKGNFVPKMRPRALYEELKGIVEKARVDGTAEASAKLHENHEQGAVTPGSGKTQSRDYEGEALFERASATSSNEDWAKVLKKMVLKK
jgi:hypothetical protein